MMDEEKAKELAFREAAIYQHVSKGDFDKRFGRSERMPSRTSKASPGRSERMPSRTSKTSPAKKVAFNVEETAVITPWSLRRLHRSGRFRLPHLALGGSLVDAANLSSTAVPRHFCPCRREEPRPWARLFLS